MSQSTRSGSLPGTISLAPPQSSLTQSSLTSGMPLLYYQSSLSAIIARMSAPAEANNDASSVPSQLLLPDGGVALGLVPSAVSQSGSSPSGTTANAFTEASRVNLLRQAPIAVLASETSEDKTKARRSHHLLFIAVILSLKFLGILAILQGKDRYPIFSFQHGHVQKPNGESGELRYAFYVCLLIFTVALPASLAWAITVHRRQLLRMADEVNNVGNPLSLRPSVVPSIVLSGYIVALTGICLVLGLFIMWTWLDLFVFALSVALRCSLNNLVLECISPRCFLLKASSA